MKTLLPPTILAFLFVSLILGCKDDAPHTPPSPPSLHWEVTNLSAGTVLSLAVDNVGTVFASIDGDGIYKSMDHGTNWTKPKSGPFRGSTGDGYAQRLLVDGFTLWAGTDNAGIHRSSDEGASWEEVPSSAGIGRVFDLCLARETAFCASDSGIFVLTSQDQWRRIDTHPVRAICGNRYSTWVFAGGRVEFPYPHYGSASILWSPERQGGWYVIPVSSGDWVNVLAQAPNGDHYAGIGSGGTMLRHRAHDSWWSWQPVGLGSVSAIAFAPNNDLFVASWSIVYRSTDDGDSWDWSSEGLAGDYILTLASNPAGYLFAGTNEGVFRARF